ncbi:PREDICTED: uncharacterized protein LOC105456813 [Wasmannia auropunctata]|uniref:uncharacterized protein LOC105456813 n=1 Tax=Wasmannia auropunctata TaxID=64793 RepID=UPI0005ED685C|nr:PREDICTED: uncharacterized protein LOC105456813 [Wasmannia auropunctata]
MQLSIHEAGVPAFRSKSFTRPLSPSSASLPLPIWAKFTPPEQEGRHHPASQEAGTGPSPGRRSARRRSTRESPVGPRAGAFVETGTGATPSCKGTRRPTPEPSSVGRGLRRTTPRSRGVVPPVAAHPGGLAGREGNEVAIGGPTASSGHHTGLALDADKRRLRPASFFAGATGSAADDAAEATNAVSASAAESAADDAAEAANTGSTEEPGTETASEPAAVSAAATKGAGATAEPCGRASSDIGSTIKPTRRVGELD